MGRRLSQHFLFDPAILDRIVDAIWPERSDRVVEIGTGKGTLTRRLAPRVGSVVTIEREPALADEVRAAGIPGVTVVTGDALDLDWIELAGGSSPALKAIGNVPYAITTPLLDKALAPPPPSVVVFLVQREVGDRIVADPGTKAYGALSVGVQTAAQVERLFPVRAGSFRPPPKVESVVVRLVPLSDPPVAAGDRPAFRSFVNGLFAQRRRQLARALRTVWQIGPEPVQAIVAEVGCDPRRRPEVLAPLDLVRLYHAGPR